MSNNKKKVIIDFNSLLPTLLLVLFIGLKLTGYITWSWIWVLSPLWIPFTLAFILIILIGICYAFLGRD